LLSALDQTTGCVLSQTQMPPTTNEAKAALELLKTITLKGRVVVADAMFCQREVCEQILQEGGHYLVVVKENQPTLLREIESAFADTKAFSPLDAAAVC
jgi:predicted transposase YbfD/YdcC